MMNTSERYLLLCLLCTALFSCSGQTVRKTDFDNYSITQFAASGLYKDSATISVIAYSDEFDRHFPVVAFLNEKAFVPDSVGLMTFYMAPGVISGYTRAVAFADAQIVPFHAQAQDSIVISIHLQPSDYEYIQSIED